MFEGGEGDAVLARLRQAELGAAHAFLAQLDALGELWEASPLDSRTGREPQVLAEAGACLGLHPVTVDTRLGVLHVLTEHPLLRRLLETGGLGVPHLLVAVEEVGALGDPVLAARVLQRTLAGDERTPPGWAGTPPELRRALRRAAVAVDPEAAAARRREQTRARTGVRLRPLADGLAALVATGPATAVTTAQRLLAGLAGSTGPDDSRTAGQRQVDALVGALAAQARARLLPGLDLELQVEVPVEVTAVRPTAPGLPPEPVTIRSRLTARLIEQLLGRPRSSRRGADDTGRPVELVGHGAVDPDLLDELLLDADGLPAGLSRVHLRRLCVDRTGEVVAVDDRPTALPRLLARLDRGRADDPADLVELLLTDLPAPPPMTAGHDPTARQQRLVRLRDRTCRFPGCHRPARGADLDHRTRWPEGPTTVVNLQPLCRGHHRLKHDGWRCRRRPDGTTVWTSPRGSPSTCVPGLG